MGQIVATSQRCRILIYHHESHVGVGLAADAYVDVLTGWGSYGSFNLDLEINLRFKLDKEIFQLSRDATEIAILLKSIEMPAKSRLENITK